MTLPDGLHQKDESLTRLTELIDILKREHIVDLKAVFFKDVVVHFGV